MENIPHFCLKGIDEEGREIELCDKDLKGWSVIYFYPKDNTQGCTIEAKEFSSLREEFDRLGVRIIGISKDSVESHKKFREKHNLRIVLLSDPSTEVIRKFGAWGKRFGRETTIRSTFIVDPEGNIRWKKIGVKAKGHAKEVLDILRELIR